MSLPHYRKVSKHRKSVAPMKNVHILWLFSLNSTLTKCKFMLSLCFSNKNHSKSVFTNAKNCKTKKVFPFWETGHSSSFLRRSPISSFSAKLLENLKDCPWSWRVLKGFYGSKNGHKSKMNQQWDSQEAVIDKTYMIWSQKSAG